MVANVALGIVYVILSMVKLSLFLGFAGAFNIVLAIGKFYALQRLLRIKETDEKIKNTVEMKSIGKINKCTLICSALFFSFGFVITFFYEDAANYSFWMIMYVAATAFIKMFSFLISAVVNLRKKSGVGYYVKLMSAAPALISLAITQRAILYFVGDKNASIVSGIGGIVFGLLAMLVGIYMVVKARKEKLKLLEQGLIEVVAKPEKNENPKKTKKSEKPKKHQKRFTEACKKAWNNVVRFFKRATGFIRPEKQTGKINETN